MSYHTSRTTYSTELANRLRYHLFKPSVFRDHKARYDKKNDDLEDAARRTWVVHGVCLDCRMQAISCGKCCECGTIYYSDNLGWMKREAMAAQQIADAWEAFKL